MENSRELIIDKLSYMGNGRNYNNVSTHKTIIKNKNSSFSKITSSNGRLFEKELNSLLISKQEEKNNDNQNSSKKSLFSWVVNTFNPLNHLPVISTINKLNKKNSKNIDMLQSAIGGAIYGGGPIGLAKGIGSWFIGKIFPKDIVIGDNKKTALNKSSNIGNGRNPNLNKTNTSANFSNTKLPENIINIEKANDKVSLDNSDKKYIKNSYLNLYLSHNIKQKKRIDTNA